MAGLRYRKLNKIYSKDVKKRDQRYYSLIGIHTAL